MTVDQLPGQVREFANHLDGLLARLDQGGGWCGVFWQRDPDGMRACLDGREMPPWDVVEALLQDLAGAYGPQVAAAETERARVLHAAALVAHDARPGARDALGDRFDVMLREQRYAADRQTELRRALASAATREEADALRVDLAWAHDDHERATRRCAELQSRMARLDRRATDLSMPRQRDRDVGGGVRAGGGSRSETGGSFRPAARTYDAERDVGPAYDPHIHAPRQSAPVDPSAAPGDQAEGQQRPTLTETSAFRQPTPAETSALTNPPAEQPPAPKQRKRRRGGARFAGMVEEEAAPVVVPPTAVPDLPAAPVTSGRTPRGARFAGAARAETRPKPRVEPLDAAGGRETAQVVERLVRLRGEGRSGEAHALLAEIARWPAARYPLLAVQMERAGLGADWASLLWEAASLPAERLVAAADALVAAGRGTDGQQILRQGVARPADEIGQAVLALAAEGRHREVGALLDAYVRVRTPEEAARSAEPDPRTLVPLLVEAARGVSEERHWDLVHALRVAGFTA
ncbi:hypothetical protein ACFYRY_32355 [Streptomyces sp. NPDC005263]|uniref:hypothetical protein n=1 Tax=Streptomyces sp. NPDC005263 TaxID=3364711 RepID=UPI00368089A5